MSSTVGITYNPPDTPSVLTENITDRNWTIREPYERPFSDTAIVVSAVILLTFLVIGLIGNILTIVAITTNPKLKNIFMCFIVSLCVSDLWSAMISWLFLYRRTWGFDVWAPLPPVFCRMLITTIWTLSFLVGFIPFFIFFDSRVIDRNSDQPNARWPACTVTIERLSQYITYQRLAYPTLLYAASVAMVIVTILLSLSVWKRSQMLKYVSSEQKRRRKDHQAVFEVSLIVMSYLIGYIPFAAYEFWAVQPRPNTRYNKQFDYWFGMIQYYFLRFSECLNPIFYNLGPSKIRHYTKKFLKEKCCCCPQNKSTTNHEGSSTNSTRGTTAFK